MSEFCSVEATLQAPPSSQPKSTHPHVGVRSRPQPIDESYDTTPPDQWIPYDQPKGQSSPPPPYMDNPDGHLDHQPILRPAQINPTLRDRCQSCEATLRRLFPIALLFSYTLLGGIIFHLVESRAQPESEIAKGHRVLIDQPAALQLEKRMTEIVLDSNYNRSRRTYEVREALLWYLRQLTEEEKARWDFPSALFYSMTLYTTIGYGDTPPKTTSGRILTVVYSIIGIPLCLAALIELGDLVALLFSKIWSCFRHGWNAATTRHRRRSTKSASWEALASTEETPQEKREVQAQDDADLLSFPLSALILITICWLLFTATLFYAWEYNKGWTFAQSLYFVFISISTIGLGDFVPDSMSGKLGGIFFLLVGLALFSTTFAVVQQQLNALQSAMQREIDAQYQDSQADSGQTMAKDERGMDAGLDKMASKLPFGSRFLFRLMPESKKNNLKQYYQQKAAMEPKSIQTDDYLWAMTSMSKSYLKKIVEEKHGRGGGAIGESRYSDDTKSRDDVNSLVALCDYSLPYGFSEHKEFDF